MKKLTKEELSVLISNQKDEIDGYVIYSNLSNQIKNKKNAGILKKIADSEKQHYEKLKKYSGVDVKPNTIKIFFYTLSAKILGLSFTLKLLEKGEINSDNAYKPIKDKIPEVIKILNDEDRHELELLNLIDESKLNYIGSIVLGLNDALVELTGALAGYTFAIQNSKMIAVIGLITGISASLSMASSEFLSKKNDGEKNPLLSSLYTGVAYIFTVISLILPFLLSDNRFFSLSITVLIAILIIFLFNFYISTAKNLSFKKRFFEMAFISLGVAAISFGIGWLVKKIFNVDI